MTTEKLYFQDSHRSVFDARVLSCEPWKDGWRIVLDRTVFFPEGGGQYADPGFLGEVEVVDVHEKDGVIYHYTKEPIEAGQKVEGRILWEVRFDRMQQHTGEHIISGLVHQKFGYDNVGFHLGEDYCTMDFNGPITKDELKEIEREANRAVFRNLDVISSFPSEEERSRMEYRSKIELSGEVQIIFMMPPSRKGSTPATWEGKKMHRAPTSKNAADGILLICFMVSTFCYGTPGAGYFLPAPPGQSRTMFNIQYSNESVFCHPF